MKDKLIGLVIGILIALITMFIQSNTPLFSSKIRLSVDKAPIMKILETKSTDKYFEVLLEGKFLVTNTGFKPGAITKILIAPNDLRETPKVKIVSFDKSDISPFDTRWATFKIIVYMEYGNQNKKGFTFEFYDEDGHHSGNVKTYITPAVPKMSPSQKGLTISSTRPLISRFSLLHSV